MPNNINGFEKVQNQQIISLQMDDTQENSVGQPIDFQRENNQRPSEVFFRSKEREKYFKEVELNDAKQKTKNPRWENSEPISTENSSCPKNHFYKMRSNYNAIFKMLNNEQAGKLIKGTNAYVFDGIPFESNDPKVSAAFACIKDSLDREMSGRELGLKYGRMGGLLAIKNLRKKWNISNETDNEASDLPEGA